MKKRRRLGIAMIGYGFMGATHSQAWRVAPRFFDLPYEPQMRVIVGRDRRRVEAAAGHFGWDETETDWRRAVGREDIDLIDICTPGASHAEIAIAALDAGKHVLCEKPLANTVDEAERMTSAAARAATGGAFAMVGFNYRRVPALRFARDLVAGGRIGEVRQVRAEYLQDWLVDVEAPITWRLDKKQAGSGSLGDLGAHAVDAVQFITGRNIVRVSGSLETLVSERPLLGEAVGLGGKGLHTRGRVSVDDVAIFTARLDAGALGSFEASRFATGRKNAFRLEFSGSAGALTFDLERLNELGFYDRRESPDVQGFHRILVTEPGHPYMAAWWPAGHIIGYEHTFTHQVNDLLEDIAAERQPRPSFEDGLWVQSVLEAVAMSAASGSVWTDVVMPDTALTKGDVG